MPAIIEVNNLSKSFVISHEDGIEKYTALRDVLTQKTKKIFSFSTLSAPHITKEEFWALKDISFKVEQGDRLGIIGRNGAGKSTLLKILSRITEPTSGNIKIRGRVASLLEVGTGFHPELTGRENIFLNGAILGMSRSEIHRKFDEIVSFAEVEKFLDTPVKRYSSGMYVRLAFAVAAHLEPEILIVDEVLAVGDAQFQKKCLGKMEDVSKNQGRTVLFVSHNMTAIKKLCNTGLMLKNGTSLFHDAIDKVINKYEEEFNSQEKTFHIVYPQNGQKNMRLKEVKLVSPRENNTLYISDSLQFSIKLESIQSIRGAYITVDIKNSIDELVYWTSDYTTERYAENLNGNFILRCQCPENLLTAGNYTASFAIYSPTYGIVDYNPAYSINFELKENENSFLQQYGINHPGKTAIPSNWSIVNS